MPELVHTLERTVIIPAAPETVFRFFADSVRRAQWWGAGSSIAHAPGGQGAHPAPERVEIIGEVLEINPSQRLELVLSAYVIANGLFEIPSGALGDRNGQRRELTRIAAWWSVFTGLTGWCTSLGQLVIVRFLFGAGAAGAYPNATGVLGRWLPVRERARGQGVVWGASRLGGALAPLILVPLALAAGWRVVFLALAALGLLWAAVWGVWYRDRPAEQPGITPVELLEIGTADGARTHQPLPWRAVLRSRQLKLIVLAYGCYAWGSWFFFSWFPTWMVAAAHFSTREMGVYASVPFLLGMVGNLAGGYLCDRLAMRLSPRWAYRVIICTCLAATSLLLWGMSFATSQWAVVILASSSFAIMDLMLPAAWAMCMAIGGPHAGLTSGVMNTAGQAGGVLCTLAFGYIVSVTRNYNLPVQLIALMVLLAAAIFSRIDCTDGLVPAGERLPSSTPDAVVP